MHAMHSSTHFAVLLSVLWSDASDKETLNPQFALEEVDKVLDAVSIFRLQVVLADCSAGD
jgi:hypothetical protein